MTVRAPKVASPAETTAEPPSSGGQSHGVDVEVRAKPRAGRRSGPKAAAATRVRPVTISTPLLDGPYVPVPSEEEETLSAVDALDAVDAGEAREARTDRQAPSYPPTNAFAIISLVLAIVWLGGLGSLLAIVFGVLARGQMEQRNEGGHGMALAGIVLGVTGLVVVIALFITVPFLSDAVSEVSS